MITVSNVEKVVEKREDSIDLLRAVAVASVLLFHYTSRWDNTYLLWNYSGPRFSYGHLGVELFFIVSGYCIFMTIVRSRTLAEFFAKRLSRLWPALLACATLTFVVVRMADLPGLVPSVGTYAANLLFLFPFTSQYVDPVYWTLTVELTFYLFFGILYFWKPARILFTWYAFTLLGMGVHIADFLARHFGFPILAGWLHFSWSKLLIYPYSAYFLVGIIIFSWKKLAPSMRAFSLLPIIAVLAVQTLHGNRIEAFILGGIVLASILIIPMKFSIPRPVRFVGLVSYPLYLIHQDVSLVIIRTLGGSPYLRMIFAGVVVVAIAAFVNYVLEKRLRPMFRKKLQTLFEKIQNLFRRMRNPTAYET